MRPPFRQRLRTLIGREYRAALFARCFPRRIDRVLLAAIAVLIIVGTVLRADAIGGSTRVSVDEGGYIANANRILEGQQIATYKWAPGTSLMFAAAAVLRGTQRISQVAHSHGVAQYSQLVAEFLTLILVAVVAWILTGPWAALVAVALIATYVPLIDETRTFYAEPLGGLMLIAMFATVCWARKRDLYALMLAGIVAGLAGLVREDYAVAVMVIQLGMIASARPNLRAAIGRALFYGLIALAVVAPYVIYASIKEQRFTPIVSAGPHALFLGTYLPGGGNQFIDVAVNSKQVCDFFNRRHLDKQQLAALSLPSDYCHLPAGDAQGLFAMIQVQHPGQSDQGAAQSAALHNLGTYMLGRPLQFAHMLWKKAWNMWSLTWSGGSGDPGLARGATLLQHRIYSLIAWLGIVAGLALLWRRWVFTIPVLAMLAIAVLNTFFAITPRDNLRFMPMLFLYGSVGLFAATRRAAVLIRERRRGAPALA